MRMACFAPAVLRTNALQPLTSTASGQVTLPDPSYCLFSADALRPLIRGRLTLPAPTLSCVRVCMYVCVSTRAG